MNGHWRRPDRDPAAVARALNLRAAAAEDKAAAAVQHLVDRSRALPAAEAVPVLDAVSDILDEMFRWKHAAESVEVDEARQLRQSAAIRELTAEVRRLGRDRQRAETARIVLYGWYQACVGCAAELRRRVNGDGATPSVDEVLSWLERQLPRVRDAHQKVWQDGAGRDDADRR